MRSVNRRSWIVPLGLAAVFLFLAPFLGFQGAIGFLCFGLAAMFTLAALVLAVLPKLSFDKYDLKTLERVHEEKMFEQLLDEHMVSPEAESVVCPRCGATYPRRFPVCTNCKSSP